MGNSFDIDNFNPLGFPKKRPDSTIDQMLNYTGELSDKSKESILSIISESSSKPMPLSIEINSIDMLRRFPQPFIPECNGVDCNLPNCSNHMKVIKLDPVNNRQDLFLTEVLQHLDDPFIMHGGKRKKSTDTPITTSEHRPPQDMNTDEMKRILGNERNFAQPPNNAEDSDKNKDEDSIDSNISTERLVKQYDYLKLANNQKHAIALAASGQSGGCGDFAYGLPTGQKGG